MSFTVAVIQQKGGAGKTTLSCQLTAGLLKAGQSVAAVDTDEQQSLNYWASLRRAQLADADPLITYDATRSLAIAKIRSAQRDADYVIVDTPPQDRSIIRRVLRYADLVLIPLQLTPFDLHATLASVATIAPTGKKMLFVLNRVPPRARIADEMRAQFLKHELPVARTCLGNRAAFAECMMTGRGVLETNPSSKAGLEAQALLEEVFPMAHQSANVAA